MEATEDIDGVEEIVQTRYHASEDDQRGT